MRTDYLIIGSGVAGLTFALKIAEHFPERKITIITKSSDEESNTKYAQGGVAIVSDTINDSFEKHIKDTLKSGYGLCDKKVVEMVIKEGPKRLEELLKWGASFDKNSNGEFNLGKEVGHSENRIVHKKDQTGREIQKTLINKTLKQKNISVLEYHLAIDLLVESNRCYGCYVLNEKTGEILNIISGFTILATGGIGQVYGQTTNRMISTGDGIAMAYRAKAKIKDMEFIQFHPTAFYKPESTEIFLISEALRRVGAFLRNKQGKRFLLNIDERGELASQDIVVQGIFEELRRTNQSCVYLDCTHLNINEVKNKFPTIYNYCIKNYINLVKDWIPVLPVQHYVCGGVDVDINGKTSIENLYACGECSRTGLHGANRLASNSLLEALVYSNRIYKSISTASLNKLTHNFNFDDLRPLQQSDLSVTFLNSLETELQLLMRENAGIIRNDHDLKEAKGLLCKWSEEIEIKFQQNIISAPLCEIRNMITIGKLIISASLKRKKSYGSFLKV
ncbi:L-aspartate oxidase [Flavobacterium oreochromis]|uniref:L-aspartate oxidase n=1 Tax=Flavobacterium oreochromis TaxID=2906078 RepID=A0ABW8PAR2_9FLAO|nr:L-aspartate oxidase [Flavobacterium oreochromis]OWP78371.1 L-aspartate oxidase [Flavobacterium oreochromis]